MMTEILSPIIAIIVAFALFFTLLFAVFTDEIDTYICYVTDTGECYHERGCFYLRSSKETTVYEAKGKYMSCSRCDPYKEKYKTTITIRNYTAPIYISTAAGVVALFVSSVLIEKARKKEDI